MARLARPDKCASAVIILTRESESETSDEMPSFPERLKDWVMELGYRWAIGKRGLCDMDAAFFSNPDKARRYAHKTTLPLPQSTPRSVTRL